MMGFEAEDCCYCRKDPAEECRPRRLMGIHHSRLAQRGDWKESTPAGPSHVWRCPSCNGRRCGYHFHSMSQRGPTSDPHEALRVWKELGQPGETQKRGLLRSETLLAVSDHLAHLSREQVWGLGLGEELMRVRGHAYWPTQYPPTSSGLLSLSSIVFFKGNI